MWSGPQYRAFGTSYFGCLQQKRKTDPDFEVMPPSKMHITEEKMVSQLKGIHLSKEYTSHGASAPTKLEIEIEEAIESRLKGEGFPSLIVCDEIRALQSKVEPILPKTLMDKFQRPTNALVLWQPPAGDLGKSLSAIAQSTSSQPSLQVNGDVEMVEEDDNNNNNNEASADSDRNASAFVR